MDLHPEKRVDLEFEAPEIWSDGGLTLLRQADEQLGLSESLVKAVPDDRQQASVQHIRLEQLRRRIYQLASWCDDDEEVSRPSQGKAVGEPCDGGYECVHDGNTTNSPSATESCARRVTEGEWSRPD